MTRLTLVGIKLPIPLHNLNDKFFLNSLTNTISMENTTAIKILQEAANIAIKAGCFGLTETTNIINALSTVEKAIAVPPAEKPDTFNKK